MKNTYQKSMTNRRTPYDSHYEIPAYFGKTCQPLLDYFKHQAGARVLDLGCGQGRDSLEIARMGHIVTGIDISDVGINQCIEVAKKEGLSFLGQVQDIFHYEHFTGFTHILLDSMLHFTVSTINRERELLRKICKNADPGCSLLILVKEKMKKQLVEFLDELAVPLQETIDFEHTFDLSGNKGSNGNYSLLEFTIPINSRDD